MTALAFQSDTLIVGFEDGQVKILRQGRDALMAKPFHSSNVQELRMLSDDLFLSSGQVASGCHNMLQFFLSIFFTKLAALDPLKSSEGVCVEGTLHY